MGDTIHAYIERRRAFVAAHAECPPYLDGTDWELLTLRYGATPMTAAAIGEHLGLPRHVVVGGLAWVNRKLIICGAV